MARTIIIGDIHGTHRELHALFDALNLKPEDRVISLGDFLDKGPNVPGVVRLLKSVGAELVLGNHEEKLHRFLGHEKRIAAALAANPKQTPKGNPMQPGKLQEYLDEFSNEEMGYLASAKVFIELPEHRAIVLHGGIEPRVEKLPGQEVMGLKGKEKSLVGKLIRTRYVDRETGKMLPIGDFTIGEDPFWAEIYDGRFGHVFFGHDPNLSGEVRHFEHATGLDTAAVHGGRLTAAVLEEGKDPSFVSVPAFEKYADSLYEE